MKTRTWVLVALSLLALALAYWIVFEWRNVGFRWALFFNSFRQLHGPWVAAAGCLALLTYLGRALRWQVLLKPVRPKSSLWNLFSATAVGFTAIVIFGRPGELVRPYLISVKERVPFSSQIAAWLLERIYDLLMALLIFGFALTRVQASGVQVGETLQWVLEVGGYFVGVLGAICLVVLFVLRQFSAAMRQRLLDALSFLPAEYTVKVDRIVTAFTLGAESTKNTSHVLQLILYSVFEWILILGCYMCVFQSFPATAGFQWMDVLIFAGFVSFGCVVQVPGVGGGLQVVTVLVMTQMFGMGLEVATGMAVVLWFITFVVIVPIGLLLAFHDGLNWHKIRQLKKEASL